MLPFFFKPSVEKNKNVDFLAAKCDEMVLMVTHPEIDRDGGPYSMLIKPFGKTVLPINPILIFGKSNNLLSLFINITHTIHLSIEGVDYDDGDLRGFSGNYPVEILFNFHNCHQSTKPQHQQIQTH